jgi:large-conductance mechanosensitive channel
MIINKLVQFQVLKNIIIFFFLINLVNDLMRIKKKKTSIDEKCVHREEKFLSATCKWTENA